MNKKQGTTKVRSRYTVIKPVWWRQFAFSSFLLVTAVFFAFVDDFGLVGRMDRDDPFPSLGSA
ncbi:MAG: hypothetical protein ACJZ7A_06410 [Opitutales bacterium]